jgi:PTS system nitrogen regulatory IIA component
MSDLSQLKHERVLALCNQAIQSKKRVFERAAESMSAELDLDAESIYRALLAREKLGSTAVGEGVAIPHSRDDHCGDAAGCLITLEEPIDFAAADGKAVDIVFVLLVPAEATQNHLNILAGLATALSNSDIRSTLRDAKTAEQAKWALLRGPQP